MKHIINMLSFGLNVLIGMTDWISTRQATSSEKRLKNKVKRAEKATAEQLKACGALEEKLADSEKVRRSQVEEHHRLKAEHDELRLTLNERLTYILEVEAATAQKDTTISLQALEIEELTLWRERQLQLLRTEADIEAAKSKVLQGRNADRTLENLKNVDKKDNG